MTTILLPAGTAQLRYGDLADLIANALHDDPLKAGFAWFNLEKELAQAVMRGALMLRDPLTLGPHPMPIGAMRDDALVLLHDLRDFLKCRGIAVEVEVEQPAQVARPAPAAQVEPVQAGPTEARRILKKRVMVDELLREWPTIENDLKESSRGTHKELKAANVSYGMWDVDAARAWAESRGKLVRVTAAESIDTAWAGGLIHRIRG